MYLLNVYTNSSSKWSRFQNVSSSSVEMLLPERILQWKIKIIKKHVKDARGMWIRKNLQEKLK